MRVSMIVAAARNGVIGRDRGIPWQLPEDQKFFRRMTMGHALVLGRKTFEEFSKPLPGRKHLVLTRRPYEPVEGVEYFGDLASALDWARADGQTECFIAGGEAVYREALDVADRVYLTRVDAEPEGDTFFPELDESVWECVDREAHEKDERHDHAFVIETWTRH